ncbi:MAG: four helix bundle protein [Chitinophagaceae bacterium]|nr:MAG: four helix bundle protein [Chitinophagaceae bacterium]
MNNYKQLDAWKASMELITEIYMITKLYPKEELYALTSQTKRAAVSIAANIAEGLGRQYRKDTLQFLHISRGSLYELETLLIIALNVKILTEEQFQQVMPSWQKTIQLLNGFINYHEKAELK